MGALCVSSIALRPRTIWNAAGIGTPAGQLEPSGTCEAPLEQPTGLLERRRHWNSPQGYWNVRSTIGTPAGYSLSAEREVDAGNR